MKSPSLFRSVSGFTLIELLVTITIIGILAAGAANVFGGAQAKSRDSNRISDLEAIKSALELYYTDHEKYPNPDKDDVSSFGSAISSYLNKMPSDPKNGEGNGAEKFIYTYDVFDSPAGIADQIFVLSAHFEHSSNYPKHNVGAAKEKAGRYSVSNSTIGDEGIKFSGTSASCGSVCGSSSPTGSTNSDTSKTNWLPAS